MSELQIHTVRRRDLEGESPYQAWDDPEGLAPMSPGRRAAFLSNPLARGAEDSVQLIGTSGRRVIGRIDLLSGELAIHDQPVPTTWGSALFVSAEFRQSLMGLMLIVRMQSAGPTISACGLARAVRPIYDRLGWIRFLVPRYLLVRRSRGFVVGALGDHAGSSVLAAAADLALAAVRAPATLFGTVGMGRLRAREMDAMPETLDPLVRRHSEVAACHRSAAWINWLLGNEFDDTIPTRKRLVLVEDRGGRPLGYYLVRTRLIPSGMHHRVRNLVLGTLHDWNIFEPDRLRVSDVVRLAVRTLASLDADVIAVHTADPATGRLLRLFGFLPYSALDFLYRAVPDSPLAAASFRDPRVWRIRAADGDNFFT